MREPSSQGLGFIKMCISEDGIIPKVGGHVSETVAQVSSLAPLLFYFSSLVRVASSLSLSLVFPSSVLANLITISLSFYSFLCSNHTLACSP